MIVSKPLGYTLVFLLLFILVIVLAKLLEYKNGTLIIDNKTPELTIEYSIPISKIHVNKSVAIENYFEFIDSLVIANDTLTNYPLSEHLLVRANPWIIDTLSNTGYYKMMERDSFVYNQKKMKVLRPTDILIIPDSIMADSILKSFGNIRMDINLPEFKLRILNGSVEMFSFPIRIGQNKSKYLKMGDRITNLRTKQGTGKIIGHKKDPRFYNPVTGKQFYLTRRDDNRTTLMPRIPWLVTEINGIRNGQLIHPTTNPRTLGKAYSNGCLGVKESDAWIIYYYAPIGTKINIRYDLKVRGTNNETHIFEDVYGLENKGQN